MNKWPHINQLERTRKRASSVLSFCGEQGPQQNECLRNQGGQRMTPRSRTKLSLSWLISQLRVKKERRNFDARRECGSAIESIVERFGVETVNTTCMSIVAKMPEFRIAWKDMEACAGRECVDIYNIVAEAVEIVSRGGDFALEFQQGEYSYEGSVNAECDICRGEGWLGMPGARSECPECSPISNTGLPTVIREPRLLLKSDFNTTRETAQ